MNIPEVHLTSKRDVTRQQSDTRAFHLSEDNMPKGDGTPASIHSIIRYLDVEKSPRYKRTPSSTFCNIYAYDFAYLMGAFLPRVFWTPGAIQMSTFQAVYGKTVTEMSANALYDWFKKYGDNFGWKEVDKVLAQELANAGKCVIMVAANKSRSHSGHIVAVVPENEVHKASMVSGVMVAPLMSQAGGTNRAYFSSKWWDGHEPVKIYVCE